MAMTNVPGWCKDCQCRVVEAGNLYCARFPPTVFFMMGKGPLGQPVEIVKTQYPVVSPENGCFEFRPEPIHQVQ
jgi:hypothetical protein